MMWYEIMGCVMGSGGLMGGAYSLFTMRTKKEGLVIDNLRQVIEEIKENHKEYKVEVDKKFSDLERKVSAMELKDRIQQNAINKGYKCSFLPKEQECPVTKLAESAYNMLEKRKHDFEQNR